MSVNKYRVALVALLEQIANADLVDSLGHTFTMNARYREADALIDNDEYNLLADQLVGFCEGFAASDDTADIRAAFATLGISERQTDRVLWAMRHLPDPSGLPEESAARIDNAAVDNLAASMKPALAIKRADGYSGWQTCSQQWLSDLFHKQMAKGNLVGMANYLAFLHSRGEALLPQGETM